MRTGTSDPNDGKIELEPALEVLLKEREQAGTAEGNLGGMEYLNDRTQLCQILEHPEDRVDLLLEYYSRHYDQLLDHFGAVMMLLQPLQILVRKTTLQNGITKSLG